MNKYIKIKIFDFYIIDESNDNDHKHTRTKNGS